MGYRFSVADIELRDEYNELMASGGCAVCASRSWEHDQPAGINSEALGLDLLPDHLNAAKFGLFSPHEARLLADAIELALFSTDVRRHSRSGQLWNLIDWLRYWADEGKVVRSG